MRSLNFFLLFFILFSFTSLKLVGAEKMKRIVEKVDEKIAWDVDGKFIMPECFEYSWLSGDNYELFFETYISKDRTLWINDDGIWMVNDEYTKFSKNIGKYLNKEIPLNHEIKTGWERIPNISVTIDLKNCLEDKPVTKVRYRNKDGYTREFIDYKILRTLDIKAGKELAPNIHKEFESIREIEITSWAGGFRGYDIYIFTYGVLEINGEKLLLQLNKISFRTPKYEKYEKNTF